MRIKRLNALRKLRTILGEGDTPLSQEHFAIRTGMSLATLRSIEGGRRPLPEHCAMQIFINLAASWNNRLQQWCVLGSETPYEKKHAALAPCLDPEDAFMDDYYLHRLVERILTMFKGCPSREYRRGLLMYLSQHLKETAEGFGLNKKLLEPTEPVWTKSDNLKPWGKELEKDTVFVAVYPKANIISPHQEEGGIFDFRSHRTFRAEDYPENETPVKRSETVKKTTARIKPESGKRRNFCRTYSAPKPK